MRQWQHFLVTALLSCSKTFLQHSKRDVESWGERKTRRACDAWVKKGGILSLFKNWRVLLTHILGFFFTCFYYNSLFLCVSIHGTTATSQLPRGLVWSISDPDSSTQLQWVISIDCWHLSHTQPYFHIILIAYFWNRPYICAVALAEVSTLSLLWMVLHASEGEWIREYQLNIILKGSLKALCGTWVSFPRWLSRDNRYCELVGRPLSQQQLYVTTWVWDSTELVS